MANVTKAVKLFLEAKATIGRTTTYEEIALALGLPSSGNALGATLSPILGDIFRACENERAPRLTAIVVRKSGQDQGLPGAGFWSLLQGQGTLTLNRPAKRELTAEFQRAVFDKYAA
jgi:alkylated DNA nucleotide flippase Atl1